MPFTFHPLEIPDVILISLTGSQDNRGLFLETYKQSEFKANGINYRFVQDNFSRSKKGVLRGLHYQKQPKAQGKLVTVVEGEVFDVAVDLRRGSKTFGKWVGITLRATNPQLIFIPPGFAHGFCVLSEFADFSYKVTEEYDPKLDRGILWSDPYIGIHWPIRKPLVSEKDSKSPLFKNADI